MNLKNHYQKEIVPNLKEKLGYKSIMEVPKLEKITINSRTIKSAKIKIVISFEIVTRLLNTLLNSMLTSSSNGKNNSFNSSTII